jgi:hypothetical protein
VSHDSTRKYAQLGVIAENASVAEPDQRDAREALLDAYNSLLRVWKNADGVVQETYVPLREAYRDAIDLDRRTSPSNLRLDDVDDTTALTLREAEMVAVHGPALGTLAWSRSAEREFRDLEHSIRIQARRFSQIRRMWERGPLGLREAPVDLRKLELAFCNGGDVACAICSRDFWSPPGRELALVPVDERNPRVVCWICGDQHAPELTAELLAKATQDAERWVGGTTSYLEFWPTQLRRTGMMQGAIDLEESLDDAKQAVREMKADALGDSESWLRTR